MIKLGVFKRLYAFLILLCICTAPLRAMSQRVLDVSFDVIDQGTQSGVTTPAQIVIRNQEEWAWYWAKTHSYLMQIPPRPELDFSAHQLLLVCMGQCGSGGHDVQVQRITPYSKRWEVAVRQTAPGSNCIVTMALTQPYQVVSMPRTNLPLDLIVQNETRSCGP